MIQSAAHTMTRLKISMFSVCLIVCLCWSLLLTGLDSQILHPDEVNALRSIKKALIDDYENLKNWKSGDPCTSNWTGVLCFNQPIDDGYLHVRELQLLSLNLSGNLSPDLGRLSYLQILDVMWNKIGGSIPQEIGNMKSLQLLLLNGNQLTGPLPEEIGYLPNLDRIQIDQNYISGSLPKSFANLNKTKHFHMNNNSISGQIPPELSRLPMLVHMLLDNNNLTGYLPPELANMPSLLILQLDNNNFSGSVIPASYGNMSHLLKLSLRNCSLQGQIPDFSNMLNLSYIDVSLNQLTGPIPWHQLSADMTTIDLSFNKLSGSIPTFFAKLPLLQKLSLDNNLFNGSVPSIIWSNKTLNGNETLLVDLQDNKLTNISGSLTVPPNVTVRMQGNPLCGVTNLARFCGSKLTIVSHAVISQKVNSCPPQSCPTPYEYATASPVPCFCAAPLLVQYRLKSPGFIDFRPYINQFEQYLSSGLKLHFYQLDIGSPEWEEGPRLRMFLSLFPSYIDGNSSTFNKSEVLRIKSMFTGWKIPDSDIFGPYELLKFTLLDPYKDVIVSSSSSGVSKGAVAGIVVGVMAFSLIFSALLILMVKKRRCASKNRQQSKLFIKIDGVKDFGFEEMALATNHFDSSSIIGQGGYGKVYKGVRADGTVVAIKRAQEGSLQGEKEFLTEIELLSRLHHRNLVSLLGYCADGEEQMLIYEYMSNGTLRDHISEKCKEPLSFPMRLRIAIGSAKGILYLHSEADPPIFHRDIKATNILLDAKFTAKVADFGLSRLAPVPDLEGVVPAHVSTAVKGTPGYLDPEYFATYKLTDKSDVYSLGIVFLELLTGLPPISRGKNIVRVVRGASVSGKIFSLIDDKMGSYPSECVQKFLTLALKCCHDEPDSRPSMAEVVHELEKIWSMMPESDTKLVDSVASDHESDTKLVDSVASDHEKVCNSPSPSSSSTIMRHHYVSSDISGSDLVSGVVHSISPR